MSSNRNVQHPKSDDGETIVGAANDGGQSSVAVLSPRLTRRGRPRKVFRYLEGLEGSQQPIQDHQRRTYSFDERIKRKAKSTEKKKRKVSSACIFCRRSHMTCDDQRPCKRCCHRGIKHLCTDDASILTDKKRDRVIEGKQEDGHASASEKGKEKGVAIVEEDAEDDIGSTTEKDHYAASLLHTNLERTASDESVAGKTFDNLQKDDLPDMLSYLQEPGQSGSLGSLPDGGYGNQSTTIHSSPWADFIQATSASMNSNTTPTPVDRHTAAYLSIPTSTPAISLPQILLQQQSPTPTSNSSPISCSSSPLNELHRMLATMGGSNSPSPVEKNTTSSLLLTPSEYAEYAARRNSSTSPHTMPFTSNWGSRSANTYHPFSGS